MMRLFSLFLLVALSFTACNNDKAEKDSDSNIAVTRTNDNPINATQPQPMGTSNEVTDPNPPHGQPGHRCDIAVGASLSSAPAKGNAQPSQPTQTTRPIMQIPEEGAAPTTTTPSTSSNTTAAGFSGKPNPPHGQPGHRCDINVGDILP